MMFVAGIINITFAVVRGTAGIYYLKSYLNGTTDASAPISSSADWP